MTTGLYVSIAAILLFVIFIQIARATELATLIKGEDRSEDTSKFQAILSLLFLILGMIGLVWCHYTFIDRLLPRSGSEHGVTIDKVFQTTLYLTAIVFFLTHIALFWFTFKYRERKGNKASWMPGSNKVEAIWTIIPAIVLTFLVVNGIVAWYEITGPSPKGALNVEATGRQFEWILRHPGKDGILGKNHYSDYHKKYNKIGLDLTDPNGKDDLLVNEFYFPNQKDVEVTIRSMDVLHSFAIPHFRVKMDAVPGTPTRAKFKAIIPSDSMRGIVGDEEFDYFIACQELCGSGHNSMKKMIYVVDSTEYLAWLDKQIPYASIVQEAMDADGMTWEMLLEEKEDRRQRRYKLGKYADHGDDHHGEGHEEGHEEHGPSNDHH